MTLPLVLLAALGTLSPQVGGDTVHHASGALGPVAANRTHWEVPAPPPRASPASLAWAAAFPGLEQRRRGLDRWVLYVGAEAAGWGGWAFMGRREAGSRRAYRDVAWDEARRRVWDGGREDGPWGYYENMLRFDSSGRFDTDPSSERLVPESDPATFNGRIWELAQQIYVPGGPSPDVDPDSPEFQRALAYYEERAVGPAFAWDWGGNAEARDRYARLIRRADDSAWRATAFLGLLVVSRFVSVADVYLADRVPEPARIGLSLNPVPASRGGPGAAELSVRIRPWPATRRP